MFGPNSMNKALCGCGAIADLDSEVVRKKRGLGKRVECARCRNRRIAKEKEELEHHFQGLDDALLNEAECLRPPFPVALRYQLTKLR